MTKRIYPALCIVLTSCTFVLAESLRLFPLLSLVAFPVMILQLVFTSILHYQLWAAVPVASRSTTPGKAVGFLFIPFFNLYWYFPSYVGLSKSIERATGKPAANGLAVSYAILSVLNWFMGAIPYVGFLFGIAYFVVWLVFVVSVTKAVNTRILETTTGTPPALPAQTS